MKKSLITLTVILTAAALVVGFSGPAAARVTGVCSNCHTMHNSQGGSGMATDRTPYGTPPYSTLLVDTCVGCHTGTNSDTPTSTEGDTPYVMDTSEPDFGTNTLAGGNFWWVRSGGGDDAKGHNVLGISTQDGNITAGEGAPGAPPEPGGGCGSASCHGTLAVKPTSGGGSPDNMAGGCEGCHLNVMHHANDGTDTKYGTPWGTFVPDPLGDVRSGRARLVLQLFKDYCHLTAR